MKDDLYKSVMQHNGANMDETMKLRFNRFVTIVSSYKDFIKCSAIYEEQVCRIRLVYDKGHILEVSLYGDSDDVVCTHTFNDKVVGISHFTLLEMGEVLNSIGLLYGR